MTRTTPQNSPDAETQQSFRLPLPAEMTTRGSCPFDPPRGLHELSAKGQVHRVEMLDGEPVWLITGLDEGRRVLADPRFSSDRFRGPAVRRLPEKLREQLLDEKARAGNFISMDAPRHTRYRRLLTGQFTVARMKKLVPRVKEIVTDCLDAMVAGGDRADLVEAFALPVPSLVICELLGVSYADRRTFQERTALLLSLDARVDDVVEARNSLRQFMLDLVHEKRRDPTDDILSGLVHADTDPALTDDELVGIANLLLVAGHETTANMLGLGTFALLRHPDQLAALRADPSLLDGAVEEMLRYLSIIQFGIPRVTLEDVDFDGQVIPKDSSVVISVQEANRDARRWDDPAELDVTRGRGPHLAFGHGIHQCLGQQLARIEMVVGFGELLRRLPTLRLDTEPENVPMRTDMFIYGVHKLPVAWDSATVTA
jgi:cytochrome P450